ncbi:MAG: 16S rRNA (cytosine(1402)-N(4))-methyltransferase RsmH [Chthoniobacteraceae bacterium]|nr:16S rRNA (cytosine(1402)-N(4))-methyltransferase RsmH [Chthoniobacteraceae bacterium]
MKPQEFPSNFHHEPVLLAQTLALLAPAPGELFVDGTLGGGGHTEAILEAGARVIGLDQDPQALAFARERLARFGERFQAVRANFETVASVLDRLGVGQIDGALLDIGVSSWQLDAPERGFSFQENGPLDMRMDPDGPLSAADLVNTAPVDELIRIFREYGEESDARRIAHQIVHDREIRPLETTFDLVHSVEKVHPRRGRAHPATKVFQALRIAVNRELDVLQTALAAFSARLAPGGRLGVITFHSLEDRIVKNYFRTGSQKWLDRPEWPAPRRNPAFQFRLLTPKPAIASDEEEARNPRSRSAKLRAVVKTYVH